MRQVSEMFFWGGRSGRVTDGRLTAVPRAAVSANVGFSGNFGAPRRTRLERLVCRDARNGRHPNVRRTPEQVAPLITCIPVPTCK